jgi:hypothetical protein
LILRQRRSSESEQHERGDKTIFIHSFLTLSAATP